MVKELTEQHIKDISLIRELLTEAHLKICDILAERYDIGFICKVNAHCLFQKLSISVYDNTQVDYMKFSYEESVTDDNICATFMFKTINSSEIFIPFIPHVYEVASEYMKKIIAIYSTYPKTNSCDMRLSSQAEIKL